MRGNRMGKRLAAAVLSAMLIALLAAPLAGCDSVKEAVSSHSSRAGIFKNSASWFLGKTDRPSVSAQTRASYVDVSSAKSATVLVYMIGSDLETENGFATTDIQEMVSSGIGRNVTVALQTGGAKQWQSTAIPESTARYLLGNGSLSQQQRLGVTNMCEPSSVTDFIRWAVAAAPADRYELIFWNHGGGTMDGYGYDEHYEDSSLSIAELAQAINAAGVKFDFIGFDACLMGTIENAIAMEPFADYMIASEESESGTGWYYTNWLADLERNPAVDTISLSTRIIDDFIDGPERAFFDSNTLSIVDLTEVDWLADQYRQFMAASSKVLDDKYTDISSARASAKEFGDEEFDQIDMVDYLDRCEIDGAGALAAAVEHAVKYSDSSLLVRGTCGLAMYFPYSYANYYQSTRDVMEAVGVGSEVVSFFDSYMSIRGKGASQFGSESAFGHSSSGDDDESILSLLWSLWFDDDEAEDFSYDNVDALGEDEVLPLTPKNGGYVLQLSDSQWDTIVSAELMVMVDDGEGFIDMGTMSDGEFDRDGDLKVDFDGYWVTLDGETVPFYEDDYAENPDGSWFMSGYVPAELNGKDIEIVLRFDNDHEDGVVLGYRMADDNGGSGPRAKGYKQFKAGDRIDLYCDCYTYDGEYDGEFYYGDTIVYARPFTVGWDTLDGEDVWYSYMLTDVFGSYYYTDWLQY